MNKLQAARQAAGLTQQQLADQTGISLSTIQKYERDAKDINSAKLLNLLKMTAALKCQLEDILTDEETLDLIEERKNAMKKYVFEEYRDKAGTGSEKVFDTAEQALAYADKEWDNLVESDKKSYYKDPAGIFRVYEVELTEEQAEQLADDELEVPLSELWTKEIKDFLA